MRFETLTSVAAPLLRANVDTDAIIASRDISSLSKKGLGKSLFAYWRFDNGQPNPDFVLNDPRFEEAKILLAGENFGCGSSREAAVWALEDFGIRCVIAPSFGKIFYHNCFRNGVLAIELSNETITSVLEPESSPDTPRELTIDLLNQVIRLSNGSTLAFEIASDLKQQVLEGLDDVGRLLIHADKIEAFERSDRVERPWIYLTRAAQANSAMEPPGADDRTIPHGEP